MAVPYNQSATERARGRARRAAAAADVTFLRRLDWLLVAGVAALVGYGLWAINGITHHDVAGSPHYFLTRQIAFVVAGALAFTLALAIDPSQLQRFWKPIYIGTVAVMLLVYIAAPVTRGSHRWLDIGPFRFQPSEFGKLLFVLALAGFLAERIRRINEPRTVSARSASRRCPCRSCSCSRTSGRRSSTAPRSPRCSSSQGPGG